MIREPTPKNTKKRGDKSSQGKNKGSGHLIDTDINKKFNMVYKYDIYTDNSQEREYSQGPKSPCS